MHFCKYTDQRELVAEFTEHNTCGECYVAIRSYLDKSFSQLSSEYIGDYFSFKRRSNAGAIPSAKQEASKTPMAARIRHQHDFAER
jgi:hypothetical protein